MINLQWRSPSQLKCLAVLHCDFILPLITIHISDCRHFSDFHTCISQRSVATYLRYGGMITYKFVENLPMSLSAKEFRQSVNIWGSYGQEFSVFFFDSQCRSRGQGGRRTPPLEQARTHTLTDGQPENIMPPVPSIVYTRQKCCNIICLPKFCE